MSSDHSVDNSNLEARIERLENSQMAKPAMTIPEQAVEAAARAIYRVSCIESDNGELGIPTFDQSSAKQIYLDMAVAAIAAALPLSGVQRPEDVARAALVPFVDYFNAMMVGKREDDYPDHATFGGVEAVLHDPSTLKRTEITYGDLRRARAGLALQHTGQPQEGRAETIEQCARLAESYQIPKVWVIADAIRAMKPHEGWRNDDISRLVSRLWHTSHIDDIGREELKAALSAAPASPRAEEEWIVNARAECPVDTEAKVQVIWALPDHLGMVTTTRAGGLNWSAVAAYRLAPLVAEKQTSEPKFGPGEPDYGEDVLGERPPKRSK